MKYLILIVFLLFLAVPVEAAKYVNGYYKKDGTYVAPYWRSDSNDGVTDNYSFKGNINPYTGKEGSNYYRKDSSSPYYYGGSFNSKKFQYGK